MGGVLSVNVTIGGFGNIQNSKKWAVGPVSNSVLSVLVIRKEMSNP
jgi:hypothetical protein